MTTENCSEIYHDAKCFLCNKVLDVNTEEILLLFAKRIDENGTENCPLSYVLSSIFARTLDEDSAHSKLICQSCAQIIQEFELIEQHYLDLKYRIIRDFNKSAKQNNIPEIAFDDNIVEEDVDGEFNSVIEHQDFDENDEDEEEDHQNENKTLEQDAVQIDKTIAQEKYDTGHLLTIFEDTQLSKESFSANDEIDADSITDKKDYDSSQNDDQPEQGFVHNEDHMIEIIPDDDIHYDQIIEQSLNSSEVISDIATENKVSDKIKMENMTSMDTLSSSSISTNSRRKRQTVKMEKLSSPTKLVYTITDGDKVICLLCNPNKETTEECVEYDFRTISIHLKSAHMIRVYICDICGEEFRKRNEMNDHVDEDHGGTEDGEFHCETCSRVFTNLRLFRVHKRLHYNVTKQFSCTQCDKKYISKNLLEEHMNMHTGERPYKCNYCTKDFASKYTLTAHLKIHQNRPRPYVCKQCSKAFFSAQNLHQHEKTHSGVKDFVCEVCKKAFGTQHNLDVHKVVHTGYKPFICRICGKAFARRAEIKDHERVHTGEKPFSCNICNMSFAQRSNLTTHKRATHLNDKRFKCNQCDRSFKRRRLLDYHTRAAHTGERPFKCDMCGASFVYPEHFKKHQRIHSGEKPYACEVCGKSFNSRDNRNAHRFVHSDKKPYECLVCGQGFMRKPLLYGHMQQAGHINDTIVVNQPRISKDSDIKTSENLINEENQEIIEEHLIVEGITSENVNEDVISTQMLTSNANIPEIITPDQVLLDENDHIIKTENGLMQIVHVTTKYSNEDKDALAWVDFVDDKNS